ncbi:Transmembrane protein 65 [Cichlidogyrus casuarinus]|uniref:Transmembrane protein 65 n=1 Tax=Cichlidogyrus casuarinus TaxID=1844966 RepID=A0ABD2Q0I4_9PLAT
MAAAGFGNLISDLVGIGLVGYIERYSSILGRNFEPVDIHQLNTPAAIKASTFGRTIGITIGCLLGMLPLCFFKSETAKTENES